MDSSSSDTGYNNTPVNRDIGMVIAVLESGNSVELKATGYSMFPTLRAGDRVIVKPLTKGELPKPGDVVVCMENGLKTQGRKGATEERHNNITAEQHNSILVMHRLIEIRVDDRVNHQLITRGDSLNESDKPWPRQQLLGVALSYKRSRNEHLLKNFIPGAWRYKYNRRLLWMSGKIKRLSMVTDKLLKSK